MDLFKFALFLLVIFNIVFGEAKNTIVDSLKSTVSEPIKACYSKYNEGDVCDCDSQ